jgi:putative transposase
MPDHVHILMSIPPKYSVAEVIGYLKGKARSGSRRMWSVRHATFSAINSGPEDISFQQSGGMRR